MQQQDDKRAERCIATEMIAQDCSHCRGSFARLVGGHSALSGREHTGPLAHKAAVIFYNVTRQNPWQEGGRRRLVGRCYRPINVFKSKKLASPARPYWQALDNETVVGSAKRLPLSCILQRFVCFETGKTSKFYKISFSLVKNFEQRQVIVDCFQGTVQILDS